MYFPCGYFWFAEIIVLQNLLDYSYYYCFYQFSLYYCWCYFQGKHWLVIAWLDSHDLSDEVLQSSPFTLAYDTVLDYFADFKDYGSLGLLVIDYRFNFQDPDQFDRFHRYLLFVPILRRLIWWRWSRGDYGFEIEQGKEWRIYPYLVNTFALNQSLIQE